MHPSLTEALLRLVDQHLSRRLPVLVGGAVDGGLVPDGVQPQVVGPRHDGEVGLGQKALQTRTQEKIGIFYFEITFTGTVDLQYIEYFEY